MQYADLIQLPVARMEIPGDPGSEAQTELEALLENFVFPFATADVLFAALPPYRSEKR